MKSQNAWLKSLALAQIVLVCCALNLHGQTAPTITDQPTNQMVLPGTNVTFSVVAGGTGPFSYQWQFNGVNLSNNLITTVAGNGVGPYALDGIFAVEASMDFPKGVALDSAGNLYIADSGNYRIRKVDTNGLITTVAGNGTAGLSGNGGAATNASISPTGVTLDSLGNLYIADYGNSVIRKVGTNGIITTFAGKGIGPYAGDGGAATNATLHSPFGLASDGAGNLYIADSGNNRIRKVDTNGIITLVAGKSSGGYSGDGGAATNASLSNPSGVTLDALGNLYIADTSNRRIRKVDTNGIITTVAGNGTLGFSGDGGPATNASLYNPYGVALDAFGTLYVADEINNRIRQVDSNGFITTLAGNGSNSALTFSGDGGPPTNATLYQPQGVAVDAAGNLYFADTANFRVRKVFLNAGRPAFTLTGASQSSAGNYSVIISNAYGSVTSVVATLTVEAPPIITVQPASQIVAIGGSAIFSVGVAGSGPFEYLCYLGGTNLVQSTNGARVLPNFSTNNVGNYVVVITNNYGSVTSQVVSLTAGFPPSVTIQPASQTNSAGANVSFGVTVGGTGPFTYQWQSNGISLPNNIITTVAGNGNSGYSGDGGAATNTSLSNPKGLAVDGYGNLYIADSGTHRIRKIDSNGLITTVAGNGGASYAGDSGEATNASLNVPYAVAVDGAGNLYIADSSNARIRKVDTNGIITTVAGNGANGLNDGGPATNTFLKFPTGLAFDANGNLFIADELNNIIRKVDTHGIVTSVTGGGLATYAGDGGPAVNANLNHPTGVALDASGNLFIADNNNNRIRRVDTNGIITTVAGNGTRGFNGNGGAATNTGLNSPSSVAFDGAGNLYISDTSDEAILQVGTNGIINRVAGGTNVVGDGGAATNARLNSPFGLTFDAAGNLFIADSLDNRIREVHFAGYPTLALTNVTAAAAGSYDVIITSPYGSVTSAVATITVILSNAPPQIVASGTNFGFLTNQFGFNVAGAGQTMVVDGSIDLVNWMPLFTNTGGSSPFYFFDPAWTNFSWRFYRARLP